MSLPKIGSTDPRPSCLPVPGLPREVRRQLRRVDHWHRQAEWALLSLGGGDAVTRAHLAHVAYLLRSRALKAALPALPRTVQTSAQGNPKRQ